jgi:hypothetical protein
VIVIQVWAGAENPALTAAIRDSGPVTTTQTMPALDADQPRTPHILRAGPLQ